MQNYIKFHPYPNKMGKKCFFCIVKLQFAVFRTDTFVKLILQSGEKRHFATFAFLYLYALSIIAMS